MSRIKGWTKVGRDSWSHESKPRSIEIRWSAFGYTISGVGNFGPYKSIVEARRVATAYMRSNPNG